MHLCRGAVAGSSRQRGEPTVGAHVSPARGIRAVVERHVVVRLGGERGRRDRQAGSGEDRDALLDRRSLLRRDARLGRAALREHPLPASDDAAHDRPEVQSNDALPTDVCGPRVVEGEADRPALRRRRLVLRGVGQRQEGRLLRGRPPAVRVRRHRPRDVRHDGQHRRGARPQVVRWQLCGGPGHDPLRGHLSRRGVVRRGT